MRPIRIIEVYFDSSATIGGEHGCYRARLRGKPEIHDAGITELDAISKLMRTAHTFELSDNYDDYTVERL